MLAARVDSIVWLVLGLFLLTLVGGLTRKLRKDRCLAFLDGDRVSFVAPNGLTLWGQMDLTSQGFALYFDAPHVDERDLSESGAVVFPPELSGMIALCRTSHGLTDAQRARRADQVARILHPSRWSVAKRNLGNVGGMARDALVDTIGLLVGQLGATRAKPVTALVDRQKQVGEAGGAILDLGARAYEPLLDRHIGLPVIVRIDIPGARPLDAYFPGHLADYNERYLVVVSDSLEPEESSSIAVGDPAQNACAAATHDDGRLEIACTCDDAIVVKRVVGRAAAFDVGAVLLPGARLSMHVPDDFDARAVEVDRTRRLDLVCPRARAQVRFIATRPPIAPSAWKGIGPIGVAPRAGAPRGPRGPVA